MNFRFEHIEFLPGLALLLVPVLLFLGLLRWKKKTRQKIGEPALVNELVKNYSPLRFTIKFIVLAIALGGIIIAAANLQSQSKAETVSRKGVDVMVALDVSNSMLAEDIKPNRLERAKQLITTLLDKMDNDRIGLILFAGRAYLQMPLTTDHSAAKMYVQTAGPDAVPTQGTVIADALKIARDLETRASENSAADSNIALIYVGLNDNDKAMIWLNKAYQARFNPSILMRPAFDPLRSDARFQDLLRRIGLPQFERDLPR